MDLQTFLNLCENSFNRACKLLEADSPISLTKNLCEQLGFVRGYSDAMDWYKEEKVKELINKIQNKIEQIRI